MPPEPVFFLDRNMGRKTLPALLRTSGFQIEIHDDHFAEDTPDEEWLAKVGAKGWIVLTNDRRIRYRPIAWAALLHHQVRAFSFTTGNLSAEEMYAVLLKARGRLRSLIASVEGPFIATITKAAEVRIWKQG